MSQQNNGMRIILAGGGTGGPVMPLLAVAAELKKLNPEVELLFVGTGTGPERGMVETAGIQFTAIPAAKFRRYFSFSNFTDIFVFIKGLFAARKIIKEFKPTFVFGAGGYVAVPISWMAKLAGVRVGIHQQDAHVGLANRMIWPFAEVITTALESTSKQFSKVNGLMVTGMKASEWTGNPVRPEFFTPASDNAKAKFALNDSLPILLVFGGATGANQINQVVTESLPELVKSHQIIHVTGPGKNLPNFRNANYHPYEYLSADFPDALKIADMVIARAGLSTMAELSALGKVAIIVPMPGSHQEENAAVLKERRAAVVLNEQEFTPSELPRIVNAVKFNPARQKSLIESIKGLMPHDAAQRIAKIIIQHAK
jgi:UDP-N-acetylglucosamine--N-acetylmuramyl-(pentapeptide) pyrophosphoryl-undecaprenol N-acetylglucosamine transferase